MSAEIADYNQKRKRPCEIAGETREHEKHSRFTNCSKLHSSFHRHRHLRNGRTIPSYSESHTRQRLGRHCRKPVGIADDRQERGEKELT